MNLKTGSPHLFRTRHLRSRLRKLWQRAASAVPVRDEEQRILQLSALHGCRRRRACAAQLVLVAAVMAHPVGGAERNQVVIEVVAGVVQHARAAAVTHLAVGAVAVGNKAVAAGLGQ